MSPSRRDYLTIAAVDPLTGRSCDVLVSYDRVRAVSTRSLGQASECAFIVPEILQHPTAVFEGLRRDEDEDRRSVGRRCYCGLPTNAYALDGTPIPPYQKKAYLVFVNDEGVAYNWRWEEADPDNPRLPVDYSNRFRQQLL